MKSLFSMLFGLLAALPLVSSILGLAILPIGAHQTSQGDLLAEPQSATEQVIAQPDAVPLGTPFTYQGRLYKSGTPITGNCAASFKLFDADTSGSQIGGTITSPTLQVRSGLFTIALDFGVNAFDDKARWLETAVGCGELPVTLAPRVALRPAPSAHYASRAATADNVPGTLYHPPMLPQSLDLTQVDARLAGFFGGFTDGRYGYFVPFRNSSPEVFSGMVARVDLNDFTPSTVITLDLSAVDSGLKGFAGGFTDGRFGYFVPGNNNGTGPSGKLARVDLQNFTEAGVTTLDLASVDIELKGFNGGYTDGRFGYLVPFNPDYGAYSGKIARVDLRNFTLGGITTLDLESVDPSLMGFTGGFIDGHHGYFVQGPGAKVARVDLATFSPAGVTFLDLASVDSDLRGAYGGFTDGRYGYVVPYHYNGVFHSKVARLDLRNFSVDGVTLLDLAAVDTDLQGFNGGFTDGRYGYFVPSNKEGYQGKAARIDLQNFSTSGVTSLDLSSVDTRLKVFKGGFTDGRYGYFVPFMNDSGRSGTVARIQLVTSTGAP